MDSSEQMEPKQTVSADGPLQTEDGPDSTEQNSILPLDIIFEVLKNERRRLVLEYLRRSEDAVPIGDLAEHIAAYENGISRAELNAQQRKRVYIGLYQCHLPKMDDADAVEFNQDRGMVELGENADILFEYLDSESDGEPDSMLRQYTAFSLGGGVAFLAAVAMGTPMLPEVVVFVLLAGIPAVTYYSERTE